MSGTNGKYWPAIISALLVVGIAFMGWGVSEMKDLRTLITQNNSDLNDKIDEINKSFNDFNVDYRVHKTDVQNDIEALQKKE